MNKHSYNKQDANKLLKMTQTKLDTAMEVLRQVAERRRKTQEQRLCYAAVEFLDSQPTNMELLIELNRPKRIR